VADAYSGSFGGTYASLSFGPRRLVDFPADFFLAEDAGSSDRTAC
jgi:hypothetical protein